MDSKSTIQKYIKHFLSILCVPKIEVKIETPSESQLISSSLHFFFFFFFFVSLNFLDTQKPVNWQLLDSVIHTKIQPKMIYVYGCPIQIIHHVIWIWPKRDSFLPKLPINFATYLHKKRWQIPKIWPAVSRVVGNHKTIFTIDSYRSYLLFSYFLIPNP